MIDNLARIVRSIGTMPASAAGVAISLRDDSWDRGDWVVMRSCFPGLSGGSG